MKIAVRGWPEPHPEIFENPEKEFKLHTIRRRLLITDTETTIDQLQRLTFGSAKIVWLGGKDLNREPKLQKEILYYADDLNEIDPKGFGVLREYCDERKLLLIPQHDFCTRYLNRCVDYVGKDGKLKYADYMAVFFNMPFDVSRLAYGYGKPRGDTYKDGFAFRMFKEGDKVHPTYTIKNLDSRKSFTKGFAGLDARTLVSALTDQSMNLRNAGEAFGVPEEFLKDHVERYDEITPEFIDYNRQDVTATAYLAAAAIKQYSMHPVAKRPQDALSSASLGKAYYEAMGITPMLSRDVPKDNVDLGNMSSAFYGGRSECRIRKVSAPVAVHDFVNMYGTVNTLMGIWKFIIAETVRKEDCSDWARKFFDLVTLDKVLDRVTWPQLTGFALIQPNGDLLPVRAEYQNREDKGQHDRTLTVGLNYLWSDIPMWFAFADLAASKLLTGKTPKIIRAYRLVPGEPMKGLRPVKVPGMTVSVNPYTDDFFKKLIEQRAEIKAVHPKPVIDGCVCGKCRPQTGVQCILGCFCGNCTIQTGLKCLVNGTAYGIKAETIRDDLLEIVAQTVYGYPDHGWTYQGTAYERPGKYSYMPIASLITSGARLMLGILEKMVTDLGGGYVFTDTDSMAVVAGAPSPVDEIRSLTYEECEAIRERINKLNPYEGVAGKALLKWEYKDYGQLYAYAISAKRYALHRYEDGLPVVPKNLGRDKAYKEHALGLYLSPVDAGSTDKDWMREAWQYIIDNAHGLTYVQPEWANRPALIRTAITRPVIMDRFRTLNGGKAYEETVPYQDRIKPFNFLLTASEIIDGRKDGRRIITGYTRNPQEWMEKDWYDLHNPDSPPLRLGADLEIKTLGQILNEFRFHPEPKSLGPKGQEWDSDIRGLLRRREIHITDKSQIMTIGKESNKIDEQVSSLIASPEDVYTYYGVPDGSDAGETRWCRYDCGKPVENGKDFCCRNHYKAYRKRQSRESYEINDEEMEEWLSQLRENSTNQEVTRLYLIYARSAEIILH